MSFRGIVGIAVLFGLAWLMSEDRRRVPVKTVLVGFGLQLLLALLLIKFPPFKALFLGFNELALALEKATTSGTSMVFGFLGGGPLPYRELTPGSSFILAFRGLPLVLVVSALSSLLFYWKVLPLVVRLFSWLLRKTMGIGGAVGVAASANIFVGMIEAPLLIRPYLAKMSRGELFMVMTCGMSTVAGTVLVLYSYILQSVIPDALGHILTASIISAPAAIVIADLMVPHRGEVTQGEVLEVTDAESSMDAVTRGTADGLKLLLNIVAMLVVLIALVSLVNQLLGMLPAFGGKPLTLQSMLGVVAAPLVWVIGVPWEEAMTAGSLLGTKTILNEFIAYLDLAALPAEALSERSRMIMTYALCGFANFGSLGIMIGGMGTMVPERRKEIVSLGFRSILSGLLATCMTGAIVGLLN